MVRPLSPSPCPLTVTRISGAGPLNSAQRQSEGGEQPGGGPPLTSSPTQPTPSPPHPTQPGVPLAALSQVIPGLQAPDPNNIYDQLRFYEGAFT
jgi:hypothetical protein